MSSQQKIFGHGGLEVWYKLHMLQEDDQLSSMLFVSIYTLAYSGCIVSDNFHSVSTTSIQQEKLPMDLEYNLSKQDKIVQYYELQKYNKHRNIIFLSRIKLYNIMNYKNTTNIAIYFLTTFLQESSLLQFTFEIFYQKNRQKPKNNYSKKPSHNKISIFLIYQIICQKNFKLQFYLLEKQQVLKLKYFLNRFQKCVHEQRTCRCHVCCQTWQNLKKIQKKLSRRSIQTRAFYNFQTASKI
eukprot:TRINITY_DN6042_c0_g1_i4.p3 TRINITY_DN6042_c0_g1~~TRINITY_DN6042_c0_g1_i4.p3  ORF type:complete len:240 (-),score=-3.42 TRINITY_DN6042_c0_g1_i4:864-1583(-)